MEASHYFYGEIEREDKPPPRGANYSDYEVFVNNTKKHTTLSEDETVNYVSQFLRGKAAKDWTTELSLRDEDPPPLTIQEYLKFCRDLAFDDAPGDGVDSQFKMLKLTFPPNVPTKRQLATLYRALGTYLTNAVKHNAEKRNLPPFAPAGRSYVDNDRATGADFVAELRHFASLLRNDKELVKTCSNPEATGLRRRTTAGLRRAITAHLRERTVLQLEVARREALNEYGFEAAKIVFRDFTNNKAGFMEIVCPDSAGKRPATLKAMRDRTLEAQQAGTVAILRPPTHSAQPKKKTGKAMPLVFRREDPDDDSDREPDPKPANRPAPSAQHSKEDRRERVDREGRKQVYPACTKCRRAAPARATCRHKPQSARNGKPRGGARTQPDF